MQFRPPDGESFADVCNRTTPATNIINYTDHTIAIFAHAGVIRAALSYGQSESCPEIRS